MDYLFIYSFYKLLKIVYVYLFTKVISDVSLNSVLKYFVYILNVI